jgi:pimeloyl-ACP methyl ester carboxylesterase
LTPFTVDWSEVEVARVLDRVRDYPWPPAPKGGGWTYGTDEAFLRELTRYWTDGYDWRAAQAELNRWPQFTTRVEDFDLHFVHVVGEAQGRRPLLITHGWPGSHYEFWQAIEPLAYPSRRGGDPADAFDLVIPSLPGFGFSSKPDRPFGQRGTARLFDTLMTKVLGYPSYLAQGGDWGGLVTSLLGLEHGANCRAIHLNMIGLRPPGPPRDEAETAWLKRAEAARGALSAYFQLQATKPQSLAWMAAGNPVGQAAWIVERFHDWSDLREKSFERAYSYDQLLTNVMIYVMTGSFTTGAWYYRALFEGGGVQLAEGQRCETPTAIAAFHDAIGPMAPRGWVERAYNVVRWTDHPRGGHFAAMEEPELFVEDVRAWAREVA